MKSERTVVAKIHIGAAYCFPCYDKWVKRVHRKYSSNIFSDAGTGKKGEHCCMCGKLVHLNNKSE